MKQVDLMYRAECGAPCNVLGFAVLIEFWLFWVALLMFCRNAPEQITAFRVSDGCDQSGIDSHCFDYHSPLHGFT